MTYNEQASTYLIQVIKSVITNQKVPLCPETVNISDVLSLASTHKCFELLYAGREGWLTDELADKVQKTHQFNAYVDFTQQAELSLLCGKLADQHIPYLPLKGILLKKLYPSSILREMGDLDILVDLHMTKEYGDIMDSLGYEVESKDVGNHDIFVKRPIMHVELHRYLFDSMSVDLFPEYYQDILSRTQKLTEKPYERALSLEDTYIYLLAHMSKHNELGGVGIRSIVDTWIYLRHYQSDMDWTYIHGELEILKLTGFEENVRQTVDEWFNSDSLTELSSFSIRLVLSGVYGNMENKEVAQISRVYNGSSLKTAKIKYLLSIMFPSVELLRYYFPKTADIVVLRPFHWLIRWFICLFTKWPNVKKRLTAILHTDKKDIEKQRNMYEEN